MSEKIKANRNEVPPIDTLIHDCLGVYQSRPPMWDNIAALKTNWWPWPVSALWLCCYLTHSQFQLLLAYYFFCSLFLVFALVLIWEYPACTEVLKCLDVLVYQHILLYRYIWCGVCCSVLPDYWNTNLKSKIFLLDFI